MADGTTPKLGLTKPEVGASRNNWGDKTNANWDKVDNLLPAGSYTAADVLAKLLTVDGAGSGLDADLLDGQTGSYYATDSDMTAAEGRLTSVENVNGTQNTRLTSIETVNTNQDTAIALRLTDAPSDGNSYARLNGTWAEIAGGGGTGAGGSSPMEFVFSPTTTLPPSGGQIRINSATQTAATTMWISEITAPGADIANALKFNLKQGSSIYIQDKDSSTQWQLYEITGIPMDSGAYWTIPISWKEGGTALPGGQRAVLSIIPASGSSVYIGDNPPANALAGQLWYESDSGNTYIYYDDGDSKQWVMIASAASAGDYVAKTGAQSMAGPLTVTQAPMTVGGLQVQTATAQTHNRIVNGAFQISQEWGNTGTSNTTALAFWTADQWVASSGTSPGTANAGRLQLTAPNAPGYRFQIVVGTAKAALAAIDHLQMIQSIEGLRTADFRWGTAFARQVVLRFGFKAPAGTYSIRLTNAVDRTYVANFTISPAQANTDTIQIFIIPGETAGTWVTDNTRSIYFSIVLAAGSSFNGVVGWQTATSVFATTANTNGMATVGNTFQLFDVGLYLDPNNTGVPPQWEIPDEASELITCMRYWERGSEPIDYRTSVAGTLTGITTAYGFLNFKVMKRVAPAMSASGFQYYTTADAMPVFTPSFVSVPDSSYFSGGSLTNWKAWGANGVWFANARM